MSKKILIDAVYAGETRLVILSKDHLDNFDYESSTKQQIKGNIYLGKVTRVEASLQAAFVDYGGDRQGFLPFAEIHPDYYNIPVDDRSEQEVSKEENATLEKDVTDISASLKVIEVAKDLLDGIEQEEADKKEEQSEEVIAAEGAISDDATADSITDINPINDDVEVEREETIYQLYRKYKIQEVIKKNQVILVQVIKEERGNKGATLSSYLSLAGRFCVLMPNSAKQGGISRRIMNVEDRRRIKEVVDGLNVPEGTGVIIRTAGSGKSKAEIIRDYDYLVRLWNNIREHTLKAKAPAFIYSEGSMIKRFVRDSYDKAVDEIIVQGDAAYSEVLDFMKMIMPNNKDVVKNYKHKIPLFTKYKIEDLLNELNKPIAKLPSGGYLVIEQTEAMVSVDVNSGKLTSERNIEETAYRTNMEAAHELARQIKLRDLSGLIVVDFIDMVDQKNRFAVERTLRDLMQSDKARVQVGRISPFGLLEMSKQRLRSSYTETHTTKCNHCLGTGVVRSSESLAIAMFRAIEHDAAIGDYEQIKVFASSDVAFYVLNHKRLELNKIELRYSTNIVVQARADLFGDNFVIEKVKKLPRSHKLVKPVSLTSSDNVVMEDLDKFKDSNDIEINNVKSNNNDRHKSKKNWRWFNAEGEEVVSDTKPVVNIEDDKAADLTGDLNRKRRNRKYPNKRYNNKRNNNKKDFNAKNVDPKAPAGDTSLLKEIWKRIMD
jgi:ribonuclease E